MSIFHIEDSQTPGGYSSKPKDTLNEIEKEQTIKQTNKKHQICSKELIQFHKKIGNQWKLIQNQYAQKQQNQLLLSQSYLKNNFYSLLRQGIRKINLFLEFRNQKLQLKNKIKLLRLNFVFKLSNLAESEKKDIQFHNRTLYRDLLYRVLDFNENVVLEKRFRKFKKNNKYQGFVYQQNQLKEALELVQQLGKVEKIYSDANLNKRGQLRKSKSKILLLSKAYKGYQSIQNQQTEKTIFEDFNLNSYECSHCADDIKISSCACDQNTGYQKQQMKFIQEISIQNNNSCADSQIFIEDSYDPLLFY